jgi:dUTP pyrophosphatase
LKLLNIKYVKLIDGAEEPTRAKVGDAAYDLYSIETLRIEPMYRRIVRTGIAVEIPEGYYGRIAPRSGLAAKNGIMVMGGVIDSSYRGDVGVILANFNIPEPENVYGKFFGSRLAFEVQKGDRIAQLIIEKCYDANWEEVNSLDSSSREDGGFGSTGL